jgi:hypothetical protein
MVYSIVGSGLGAQVLPTPLDGADSSAMVGSVASNGTGGVVLMTVIGSIKKVMAK